MSGILTTHPLLSDRVRLGIMGVLASNEEAVTFNDLLEGLGLTKGNLSSHMKKLEDEGLVKVSKTFVERKPRTCFECTSRGREALNAYLEEMQRLILQMKK